jgi:PadR family transcriptional regulator PadR
VAQLSSIRGLELTESTVYPVLTRLAREGLLSVRVEPSPSGPPRRYYRLTGDGREQLRRMAGRWKVMSDSLSNLLEGAEE